MNKMPVIMLHTLELLEEQKKRIELVAKTKSEEAMVYPTKFRE